MATGDKLDTLLKQGLKPDLDDIAIDVEAVTPGTPFTKGKCRALWIGTAGNLSFTTAAGTAVSTYPVVAGLFPIACTSVESSGTTAANILALY